MSHLQQVLLIAAIAGADPRSVRRFLNGGLMRPSVTERIDRAIEELGLRHLRRASTVDDAATTPR